MENKREATPGEPEVSLSSLKYPVVTSLFPKYKAKKVLLLLHEPVFISLYIYIYVFSP